jgi:hypothetical protein
MACCHHEHLCLCVRAPAAQPAPVPAPQMPTAGCSQRSGGKHYLTPSISQTLETGFVHLVTALARFCKVGTRRQSLASCSRPTAHLRPSLDTCSLGRTALVALSCRRYSFLGVSTTPLPGRWPWRLPLLRCVSWLQEGECIGARA